MSNRPEDSSSGRWWEIQGEVQLDEGGPRELMTDSRGRSRPERSLSAGADLADESGHPARAFLWPIVSAVAAVGLIVSVVYGVKGKSAAPASATPPGAAARSSVQDDSGVKQDPRVKPPAALQLPQAGPPATGGVAQSPVSAWSGTPRGPAGNSGSLVGTPVAPANITGAPSAAPGSPASPSIGSTGAPTGQTGNQPSGTPNSGAATPYPAPELDGSAPAAPTSHKVGPPEPGTGGCKISDSRYYSCNIPHDAPYYLAGTAERHGPIHGEYLFVCQSAGSRYSLGNRTNHWWAWLSVPYIHVVVWVPVVFLTGGPDNAPEPGLPVCDPSTVTSTGDESTSTTKPSATPTSAPTTTRNHAS